MQETTIKELAKAGVLFLVMGVAIYVLWKKGNETDKRLTNELVELRQQNKECQSTYQALLLEQLKSTTTVIQDNTRVMRRVEQKLD